MKHLKILGGLLIAYTLNSCSIFSEAEPTELPPATQTGANTFGCLINGKVFQARGDSKYEAIDKDFNYGSVNLSAVYVKNGKIETATGLSTPILNGTGSYIIEHRTGLWYGVDNLNLYGKKNKPLQSKLVVTKFERGEDKVNNLRWLIVSGTFEGIILNDNNPLDTIKITEGRFDVKFN